MQHFLSALHLCGAGVLTLGVLLATPAAAANHSVPAGGDLQAALDAAQPGDVILLESGATYTGNFRLPLKAGDGYVTVRSNARDLPAAGVRVSPQSARLFAKIRSGNTAPALTTADAAHHWRIEAVEFQANTNGSGDIIVLGSASQTQASQMPHHLVFDRVYIHGDATAGQKRAIALQSGYTEIINSYIADIKAQGQDSQAICGWNGSGPYLIENNYLEAAGENVLFGGADPVVRNLVPGDITIRGNLLSKPLSWQQEKWSVKNALELKNARRVLIEGNIIENVWKAGQPGFAVLFTPRNQDGNALWSVIEDVTFRYNVIRHAGGAINIAGWDDEHDSQQTKRIQIADNLVYDIDSSRWGGAGIFLQIGNSPTQLTIERNTVMHSGNVVTVYGTKDKAPWVTDGFVFRDNLVRHNAYGVKGDGTGVGIDTLSKYFSHWDFDRNVLAGGEPGKYPSGNYFPSVAEFEAAFLNPAGEDFALVAATPFRSMGSNGGAVGADIARVTTAVRGGSVPPPSTGVGSAGSASAPGTSQAVCRPGAVCSATPPSRRTR
jgi:hypothetical protein